MGSLFKTSKPAPPPPPPPPAGYRDEINNVEQVPVTNADGSITYITREIPLSAEEQAERDELNTIMDEALREISELSGADYDADEETQKILQAWEEEKRFTLNRDLEFRQEEEEKELARRGLSDSAAGRDVRRQRQLDAQDAGRALDREVDLLGDDIRNQRLEQQYGLYNLAASEQDATRARQQQSAVNSLSQTIGLTNANRASVLDYYNAGLNRERVSTPNLFSQVVRGGANAFGSSLGSGLGWNVSGR